MSRIQFNGINTPNFGDSNTLLELAMKQTAGGLGTLQSTFNTATDAVQAQNHAQMQQMINSQTAEQLADPLARQALMTRFSDFATPTGNQMDLGALTAAVDGRGDVLNKRVAADLSNVISRQNIDANKEKNAFDLYSNNRTIINNEKADSALATNEAINDLAVMNEFLINNKDDPNYGAMQAQYDQIVGSMFPGGNIGLLEEAKASNAIKENQYNNQVKELGLIGKETAINATNQNIASSKFNMDLNAAKFAEQINQNAVTNKRLDASALNKAASNSDLYAETFDSEGKFNPAVSMNQYLTDVNLGVSALGTVPEGDFNSALAAMPEDKRNLTKAQTTQMQKVFSNMDRQGQGLSEGEKLAVYNAMSTGALAKSTWSTGEGFGLSNYAGLYEREIPGYVNWLRTKKQPAEEDKFRAHALKEHLAKIERSGNNISSKDAALQMGLTPDHPMFHYLPQHVRKSIDPNGTNKKKLRNAEAYAPKKYSNKNKNVNDNPFKNLGGSR